MIYEISTLQIPLALQNACRLIIISSDSSRALVQGENKENLNIFNEYQDAQLHSLLTNVFWQQPCTNCEG